MMLKTTRLAALTVGALDRLYQTGDGCCTFCCAQCWALWDMHNKGDLDTVVRAAPERMVLGSSWWDEETRSVDRRWLLDQWLAFDCNHGVAEEDELESGAEEEASAS